MFGSENVNKTELAFKYIHYDVYKNFYDDFIEKFIENDLEKIVDIKSNYYNVSILDSTFVRNDDFGSCYSVVQGIVFVFQIDLLSSSGFSKEINLFYKNAIDSVGGELNVIIAFRVDEKDKISDLYQSHFDKIDQIEKIFECEVFLFSIENGENEDLFYCLIKKIVNNNKEKKVSSMKKKQNKKRKIQGKITKR